MLNFRIVIITNETELELELIEISKLLLQHLNDIHLSQNSLQFIISKKIFEKTFLEYIVYFDEWKEYDKQKILDDLIMVYLDIDSEKKSRLRQLENQEHHQIFIDDMNREQESILSKIKKMNGIEYFEQIKKQMTKFEEQINNLYTNIHKTIHKSFWDRIHEELSKDEPDYLVIIPLLTDVKEMLKNCVPKVNKNMMNLIQI